VGSAVHELDWRPAIDATGDSFALRFSMVRRLFLASACAVATTVCLRSAETEIVNSEQRIDAIHRAQVWTKTNVAAMNMVTGPRGPGAFPPGTTVTCDYHEEVFRGTSPKFGCTIEGDDRVKVRYGRTNPEIFAGVAATRLLWALGFGADSLYAVRVICRKCPRRLSLDDPKAAVTGQTEFDYAAIERKMPGREIEAPSVGPGWAWPELDLVDERAGGAPLAQRDALKLLAVLLQHTDSKPEQQKLLCLDKGKDKKKGKTTPCGSTFMMIHDLGMTFGTATLMNRATLSGANLQAWSQTPVWKDAQRCIGNLPPSQTGTLEYPKISEAGRAFLADLLAQLTDAQLRDLFTAARIGDKPGLNGEGGGAVIDWIAAFKKKRDEIEAARCG
jgi:hypothetical protein